MPLKFTIQDDAGTHKVGPLDVLAGVIQAMIEADGREHTADLLELAADRIRSGEIGESVEPERPVCH